MKALFYACVAVLAGLLSLARILAANSQALSTLVWAEDGLFPLCIKQHNYVECLVDPFAGYLLFLSRTLALPVSWFPLEDWAVITNLVAAAAVGALAAFMAWTLVQSGWSRPIAFVAAMVPVVIPIAGFEAVNASGSAYMLLLVDAALILSLPVSRRANPWLVAGVLLASGLTIPSSIVLIAPLLLTTLRSPRQWKRFTISAGALGLGLVAQLSVVVTAENPRPVAISIDSFSGWIQGLPTAFRTLWPGDISLGPTGVLEGDPSPLPSVGWILLIGVLTLVGIAFWMGLKYAEPRATGLSLFMSAGLLLGAVPAVVGFANNRYYVVPVTVFAVSLVLAIGLLAHSRQFIVASATALIVALLWWPGFPAGDFRAQASPKWSQMLSEARTQCTNGASEVALTFSPNWPFADAVFPGATTHVVDCSVLEGSGN